MDHHPTIDTRQTLETPEGTDLSLYPAGFWIRSLAYTLDWLLRIAVVVVAGIALGASGMGQGLTLVIYFLMEWFYPVMFEVWRGGQTIGKKSLHIKVINDDGTPITFAGSLIRNLLRVVDFLPGFYVTGIIASRCSVQLCRSCSNATAAGNTMGPKACASNVKSTVSCAPSRNTPVPQNAEPSAKPHSAVAKPRSSWRT